MNSFSVAGANISISDRFARACESRLLLTRNHGPPQVNCHGPSVSAFVVEDCVEPISKSSEEDNEAGELDKAEEVLSVVFPADEYATLPLYPGEEALDEPAPLVTA